MRAVFLQKVEHLRDGRERKQKFEAAGEKLWWSAKIPNVKFYCLDFSFCLFFGRGEWQGWGTMSICFLTFLLNPVNTWNTYHVLKNWICSLGCLKKQKTRWIMFQSANVQSLGIPLRLGVYSYHLPLSEAGGKHLSLEKLSYNLG